MQDFDTPRSLRRGILPSSSPFATCPCEHSRRGGLSRSDLFRRNGTRSHLPGGTERGRYHLGSSQNIQRGVLVPVQYQPTVGAHVGTRGEAFLHAIPAPTAILRGEAGRDGDDRHISYRAVVADPGEEQPPTGVADTFGKPMILHQVGDLEVFVGYQVAGLDKRTCRASRQSLYAAGSPSDIFSPGVGS